MYREHMENRLIHNHKLNLLQIASEAKFRMLMFLQQLSVLI